MSHDHGGMDMSGGDATSTSSMDMSMKMYFHATIPSHDAVWFASWVPSRVGPVIGTCIGLFLIAAFSRLLMALQRGAEGFWRKDALRRLGVDDSIPLKSRLTQSISPAEKSYTPTSDPSSSSATSTNDILPTFSASAATSHSPAQQQPSQIYQRRSMPPNQLSAKQTYLPAKLVRAIDERQVRGKRWSVPFVWGNDGPRAVMEMAVSGLHYLLMLVVMTFNLWFITAIVLGIGFGELLFGRHGRGKGH